MQGIFTGGYNQTPLSPPQIKGKTLLQEQEHKKKISGRCQSEKQEPKSGLKQKICLELIPFLKARKTCRSCRAAQEGDVEAAESLWLKIPAAGS